MSSANLYVVAVDFDGTLCSDRYPSIGEPNNELIDRIKKMKEAGIKFILWTCRSGSLLDDAINWCNSQGIVFDAINDNIIEHRMKYPYSGRKVTANEYWDDKAVRVICEEKPKYIKPDNINELRELNIDLEFCTVGGPYADCTSNYRVIFSGTPTIGEFIHFVATKKKYDWGDFRIFRNSPLGRDDQVVCEYKNGVAFNYNRELYEMVAHKQISEIRAHGGYSYMSYNIYVREDE